MSHVIIGGMMLSDVLYGLLSLLVLMVGAWCKMQETRIRDLEREGTAMRKEISEKWLQDAKAYVTKEDFHSLADELKAALVRIENKIEKLRE